MLPEKEWLSGRGAALVTVLILVLILMILSSVILSLVANQTRIMEHNIARIKAKYASEAAMVREIESARRSMPLDATHPVSGRFDDENRNWTVTISNSSSSFPGVIQLNLSIDYTPL